MKATKERRGNLRRLVVLGVLATAALALLFAIACGGGGGGADRGVDGVGVGDSEEELERAAEDFLRALYSDDRDVDAVLSHFAISLRDDFVSESYMWVGGICESGDSIERIRGVDVGYSSAKVFWLDTEESQRTTEIGFEYE